MAPVKLTYFKATGIGEHIRYLLSYGGVEFEDFRVSTNMDEFAKMKDKLPLGQLPVLEIEGKKLFHAVSIARFLGNRFNLVGDDEWDRVTCDLAADTITDLRMALAPFAYEKNEEVKKQKRDEALTKAKYFVDKLEGFLAKNGGHFLKDEKLSWADIKLAAIIPYLIHMTGGEDIFAEAPKIKALKAKVDALPAISKYLANRPNEAF
ncbi:glutathione S-transferase-like [Neocloeon triangulifer]|uniref:glutathione S-transferase-like n=1 Tax=Neocloeon triangulifer TaxID=2078957 RepID=UPI00286F82E2|nr:glutathione S-transferase-like [Neocloeon triangulifer]